MLAVLPRVEKLGVRDEPGHEGSHLRVRVRVRVRLVRVRVTIRNPTC